MLNFVLHSRHYTYTVMTCRFCAYFAQCYIHNYSDIFCRLCDMHIAEMITCMITIHVLHKKRSMFKKRYSHAHVGVCILLSTQGMSEGVYAQGCVRWGVCAGVCPIGCMHRGMSECVYAQGCVRSMGCMHRGVSDQWGVCTEVCVGLGVYSIYAGLSSTSLNRVSCKLMQSFITNLTQLFIHGLYSAIPAIDSILKAASFL